MSVREDMQTNFISKQDERMIQMQELNKSGVRMTTRVNSTIPPINLTTLKV